MRAKLLLVASTNAAPIFCALVAMVLQGAPVTATSMVQRFVFGEPVFCGDAATAKMIGAVKSALSQAAATHPHQMFVSIQDWSGPFQCDGVPATAADQLKDHFEKLRVDQHVVSQPEIGGSLICRPQYLVRNDEVHFISVLLDRREVFGAIEGCETIIHQLLGESAYASNQP